MSNPTEQRVQARRVMMHKRYNAEINVPSLERTYTGYTNFLPVSDDDPVYMTWVTLEVRDQILCDLMKACEDVGDLPFTRSDGDGLVYLGETIIHTASNGRAGLEGVA